MQGTLGVLENILNWAEGERVDAGLLSDLFWGLQEEELPEIADLVWSRVFSRSEIGSRALLIEMSELAVTSMRGNAYHSGKHAGLVAIATLILSGGVLGVEDRFKLFATGLGHDNDHSSEGDMAPLVLERHAFDLTMDVFRAHSVPKDVANDIKVLFLSTYSPIRRGIGQLRDLDEFSALRLRAELYECQKLEKLVGDLGSDKKLAHMSAIMSDADLFFSIAVDPAVSWRQSQNVTKEMKTQVADVQEIQRLFLRGLVGGNFVSKSGFLYSGNLASIWRSAFGVDTNLESDNLELRFAPHGGRVLERVSGIAWDCLIGSKFETSNRGGHFLIRDQSGTLLVFTRSGLALRRHNQDEVFKLIGVWNEV